MSIDAVFWVCWVAVAVSGVLLLTAYFAFDWKNR